MSGQRFFENQNVISLKKNGASITLEPGGQLELSGAPLRAFLKLVRKLILTRTSLKTYANRLVLILWAWVSYQSGIYQKFKQCQKRYEIMKNYMPKVGSHGLDMMMRTTTIQANFDFSSANDEKENE